MRETEAEAVAFVVCSARWETASASEDYIGLYRGDAETLLDSLQHVQRAANRILNFLLPSEEERAAASGLLNDQLALGNGLEFAEASACNPHSHAGDSAKDVRLRGKSEPSNALR